MSGMEDPVVQVIYESNREIIYTLRIMGTTFRPKVFKDGLYTLKVGEPGTERFKTFEKIKSIPEDMKKTINVQL